ncbi:MAG: HAMP domain-containing sensor histidine kinase [Eubacteriales bacterium]|nr:HAMP domain-containing sensor histidine kinase [Eubacteriales bacterium]
MKKLSIRLKITLWFSAALILMVALTYLVILSVSRQVLQKTIRDGLIETVENNVDEVEYFESLEELDLTNDVDHFLSYGSGYLEVDDDFLDQINGVYTALYDSGQTLLYGENPVAMDSLSVGLRDSVVQTLSSGGELYYVFDRKLEGDGLEGLWLRGVVSEAQGKAELSDIARLSLILMPLLVLLAGAGGYLIAGRMLRPIRQISDTALQIGGGDDLKKRIELGPGEDELHRLAESFNEMFRRLDAAFEAERQFTSDASHELRTPMSVILAQCEFSLEQPRSPEEYERALIVVERQGRRMSRLIRDMLDYTRLEMRADSYQKETVDLSGLTRSLCADMALIRERGISLDWRIQEDVFCTGHPGLLTRALSNLISNAYRYGKDGGHILVTLRTEEGRILLSVEDNGIGIAPREQEAVFRRFYQADSSRSGEGTGLGLSMVLQIARFHGGTVTLQSEPGQGSIFTFLMFL